MEARKSQDWVVCETVVVSPYKPGHPPPITADHRTGKCSNSNSQRFYFSSFFFKETLDWWVVPVTPQIWLLTIILDFLVGNVWWRWQLQLWIIEELSSTGLLTNKLSGRRASFTNQWYAEVKNQMTWIANSSRIHIFVRPSSVDKHLTFSPLCDVFKHTNHIFCETLWLLDRYFCTAKIK